MSKIIYIRIKLNVFEYKENVKTQGKEVKGFTKEWIENRIDIFMNYTLKSLKNQTNQNFLARVIYHHSTEKIVKQTLAKYDELPNNVKFLTRKQYNQDILEVIKGHDYLYFVRLDSDDMYHKSYIQKLHDYQPKKETKALINQKGYVYDSINNRLIEFFHKSPPFFTFIFKVEEFLSGVRWYKTEHGHTGVIKLPHEILQGRNYIFHAHNNNVIRKEGYFNSKKYKQIHKSKVRQILKQFIGKK
ncbi:glycosyltransferase family A protein [Oceanirhabdus seepicola]|uniref:Rhamnosyl transferase n=1 Tax=Oceanirhabdus seepicola TaxID=2828781 RepID=A0A9J6P0A5_9CLOT|nr:glycosyltransferase family A protein [Oceanirhabdus seepicola]MCM1989301.1 hypothetical protein [Oceanirhabdus seepicola]